jgi:tetratricopeptide (TPR) repeat protein
VEEGTLIVQAQPQESSEDLEALYRRGKSLYRAGNYQEAAAVIQKVVEVDPEYERAAQYLAEARERLSLQAQKDEQLAAERLALQRQQDREAKIESLLAEGREAANAGEYQRAIDAYHKALQIDPENRVASRQLSRVQRDQAKAREELEKEKQSQAAARIAQQSVQQQEAQKAKIDQLLGKADAAREAGKPEQAMNLYRQCCNSMKAIERSPWNRPGGTRSSESESGKGNSGPAGSGTGPPEGS